MEPLQANQALLLSLVQTRMPFGKYKDRFLYQLPVHYLEWFARKGYPKGKLGTQLQCVYEIKLNGLDEILVNLARL
jgi:hypothetical protein